MNCPFKELPPPRKKSKLEATNEALADVGLGLESDEEEEDLPAPPVTEGTAQEGSDQQTKEAKGTVQDLFGSDSGSDSDDQTNQSAAEQPKPSKRRKLALDSDDDDE